MIILLVALAAVVGAPMAAALLVTFASLREDSAHSLTGQPRGVLERIARRILRVPGGTRQDSGGRLALHPAARRRSGQRGPGLRGSGQRGSGLRPPGRPPVAGSPVAGSPVAGPPVPRPRLAPDEQQPSAPTLMMPRS